MQIKSWQIALTGFILSLLIFIVKFIFYLQSKKCFYDLLNSVDRTLPDTDYSPAISCAYDLDYETKIILQIIGIFIVLISVLLLKSKEWKINGALFAILTAGYSVIFTIDTGLFSIYYIVSSVFLILAGIYYFWKKV